MKQTLTARQLFTGTATVDFPVVTLTDDGTITSIESDPRNLVNEQTSLSAAFLDVHTHGAVGYDIMDASPEGLEAIQRFLATRGVAHFLPTTVTAPVDFTLRALEALANTVETSTSWDGERARPIGIHLEGPFISHLKPGVHPIHEIQPPSIELFDRFWAAARGTIALLTVAPELPTAAGSPGALELIRHARSLGVRVSLGHSYATAAEALAGIDAGAESATHTFNAMRAIDQREPGLLGTVLDDDRLFAEIICDGFHVAPALVRLWLKAKTPERAMLVTDSMSATGMPDGKYSLAGQAVSVARGRAVLTSAWDAGKLTIAGSVLTMDQAVANLQSFTGASLADATRVASHTPAAMLGRPELTLVAPGSPANLNRFDAQGRLIATYLRGRKVA